MLVLGVKLMDKLKAMAVFQVVLPKAIMFFGVLPLGFRGVRVEALNPPYVFLV